MEKDSRSGHPYHISPLAQLVRVQSRRKPSPRPGKPWPPSASAPAAAQWRRRRRRTAASPQSADTRSARTRPGRKRNSTSPATSRQQRRGCITSRKHPSRKGRSLTNQGTRPKNRYHGQQDPGVQPGDHGVVVAIGVLQHLIAQEVDGQLIQDALRQFCGQLFSQFESRLPAKDDSGTRRWYSTGHRLDLIACPREKISGGRMPTFSTISTRFPKISFRLPSATTLPVPAEQ